MIKVDIFSGFLGAGKTTLIKKLIEEAYKGEQVVSSARSALTAVSSRTPAWRSMK